MSEHEIQKFLKKLINHDKAVMFAKANCPYCELVKKVFLLLDHPITVYDLDKRKDAALIQDNLRKMSGVKSVPVVFIKGTCVGGGSNVKALYHYGKLRQMLK